ncbi:Endonuclease/Exonuclease/phosphatase family protein [Nocardioides terrae]|uniref:Endonuclease/Exonuclease/phosphatase family protein n=1 Tax=Nocardioides terrae TaxID=574651 RepID=A0A1I1EBG3_9ACTN|nr:endonuclease/exonuclease/phosphatase family protein [Nocardioides terrae]SFB84461.1 Endonuclease/Exonuclease/phosphatase family protein [Nocardioides terrae]
MPAVHRRAVLLIVTGVLATVLQPVWTARADGAPRATGTFFWANAWAAHHTEARGGAAPGAERMRRLVRLVHRDDVHLGTLAEIEHSQVAAFRKAAPEYSLLTADRGNTDGVFWLTDGYDVVETYRFRAFTYGGRRSPVPVAVLRDRVSGALLAVIAVHNPRDRWRDRALRRELEEVRRLRHVHGSDLSVFMAGDFNAGASVACRAHRARLYSAGHRRCDSYAPIDQLLVDRHVRIRAYHRMTGARVHRITDHPAVYRARFAIADAPVPSGRRR